MNSSNQITERRIRTAVKRSRDDHAIEIDVGGEAPREKKRVLRRSAGGLKRGTDMLFRFTKKKKKG